MCTFFASVYQTLPRLSEKPNNKTQTLWKFEANHVSLAFFHTVTLDFIVELRPTAIGNREFDACATLTCKFSKRILVEPVKTNWSAEDWAIVLITSLISHDWSIPQAIISDPDAKFMSDFSKTVFQELNTHLLTSTSYHPQTDGQSE